MITVEYSSYMLRPWAPLTNQLTSYDVLCVSTARAFSADMNGEGGGRNSWKENDQIFFNQGGFLACNSNPGLRKKNNYEPRISSSSG